MKKPVLIIVGFILLTVFMLGYYSTFIKEKPEYLILDIPNPQFSTNSPYSSEYAYSEEFSTFVWHDSGHLYYIWRMYSGIRLGNEGFHNLTDVEEYYGEKIKDRGWKEEPSSICNSQMREFQPNASYKAYRYPTKYYAQPTACLAVWPEFENGDRVLVLIKTINPSRNVLSDWD